MYKEWYIVITVLLILAILLDGMRRMRAHRRDHLRMKHSVVARAEHIAESIAAEPPNSELPSGGARVAAYRDPEQLVNVNKIVKESHSASRMTRGVPTKGSEPVVHLDTPVPMLMDSVEEQTHIADEYDREPTLGNLANLDDDDLQPGLDNHVYVTPQELGEAHRAEMEEERQAWGEDAYDEEEESVSAATVVENRNQNPKRENTLHKSESAAEELRAPDEVLIINIMAKKGELFVGPALLDAMLTQGLRFGEMEIFHRHESEDGHGKILFSVANMVVPGTFDLAAMDDFTTPGISMFLSLPISGDSLSAYNLMASTAQAIAEELDGELKDENRSVMTRQTIEHGRQRVIEYERKRRLAKA